MKQHYISAKRLSLWMRLVKRWKSLYRTVAQGASETKLSKLNKLSLTLGIKRKIAIASLATMATLGVQAQISFEKTTEQNMLLNNELSFRLDDYNSAPVFVDIDGDNDLDLVSGLDDGKLHYAKNVGGKFYKQTEDNNPFVYTVETKVNDGNNLQLARTLTNVKNGDPIDAGAKSRPAFVDLDGDNDLDIVVGNSLGTLRHFKNDNGEYSDFGSESPLSSIRVGNNSAPFFVDYDGDNDQDLFVGHSGGLVAYYENNEGVFELKPVSENPLGLVNVTQDAVPVLVDLDGDNDLDAFVTNNSRVISYYKNNNGVFELTTKANNPLGYLKAVAVAFADLDGDNDLDALGGQQSSNFKYYENNNTTTFINKSGSAENPTRGFTLYNNYNYQAYPVYVDVDGDNDLDLVSGSYYGDVVYYKNNNDDLIGTNVTDNLFKNFKKGYATRLEFVDLDNDTDLDVVVGNQDGDLFYFKNIGNGVAYEEQLNNDNPFNGIYVETYSHPAFIDVDGDNDLDLVVGNSKGTFVYYQNNEGVYSLVPDNSGQLVASKTTDVVIPNPFAGLDVGSHSSPEFEDLDGDGDLDLISGSSSTTNRVKYYENNNGAYTLVTEENSPFKDIILSWPGVVSFTDLDGDGKKDFVAGANNGTIVEYRNTSVVGLSELGFTKKETTTVYPNPTSNQLFVETEGNYQISDATGVVLLEGKVSKNGIDVSNLNDGYYVINVEGKISSFIKK